MFARTRPAGSTGAGTAITPGMMTTETSATRCFDAAMMQQRTDMLVDRDGRMRMSPLIAATWCVFAPGAVTQLRRHNSTDIVCLVVAGALRLETSDRRAETLVAENVAVLTTGRGSEYRWRSVGDEPARAIMLWLVGRADAAPRIDVAVASRYKRVSRLAPIAGCDTALAANTNVRIFAGVLPAGTLLAHTLRGEQCYVMPTIGGIVVNDVDAKAGTGTVVDRVHTTHIAARESTEVVVVDA
jgi:redox-sensitive bicupin YhaK (pirin superfamily)